MCCLNSAYNLRLNDDCKSFWHPHFTFQRGVIQCTICSFHTHRLLFKSALWRLCSSFLQLYYGLGNSRLCKCWFNNQGLELGLCHMVEENERGWQIWRLYYRAPYSGLKYALGSARRNLENCLLPPWFLCKTTELWGQICLWPQSNIDPTLKKKEKKVKNSYSHTSGLSENRTAEEWGSRETRLFSKLGSSLLGSMCWISVGSEEWKVASSREISAKKKLANLGVSVKNISNPMLCCQSRDFSLPHVSQNCFPTSV